MNGTRKVYRVCAGYVPKVVENENSPKFRRQIQSAKLLLTLGIFSFRNIISQILNILLQEKL